MNLADASIAMLTADYFEESEVLFPYYRLLAHVGRLDVVTPDGAPVKGKGGLGPFPATAALADLDANRYDAAVVPGGFAPDLVRRTPAALHFLKEMDAQGKPVAMICHGAWAAASAGILQGRTITSVAVIRPEVEGAGATWVDRAVVVDRNLVTSQTPSDLDVWMEAFLNTLEDFDRAGSAGAPLIEEATR